MKPTKFAVQLKATGEQMLSYASVRYGDAKIDVGHWDNDSTMHASPLPSCVQFAFVKSDGDSITGIRFYSREQHSRMFGWDTGASVIIVAPVGKCLGDMKLLGEEKLSKICMKFNVDE